MAGSPKNHPSMSLENTMSLQRVQVQGVKTIGRFSTRRDVCESIIHKNLNVGRFRA